MSTENTDPLQAADQADSPHAAHAESVSIDSVVDVAIKQFSRFGTVILDEAFDRADSQFTRRGMDVFNEFGFHMVLATPEKMLQTIQDYIGGAAVVQCFDRKHSTLALLEIEDA